MTRPSARPGGLALGLTQGGGLVGRQESPHAGPLRGFSLWEDFIREDQGANPDDGEYHWPAWAIGAAPTVASVAPTADTEIGVMRMTTAAVANRGGVLSWQSAAMPTFFLAPPIGSSFVVKIRIQTQLNGVISSGFVDVPSTAHTVAAATQGVMFRTIHGAAAANWLFVLKSGAGAGAETTLDTGLLADGTWRILAARRMRDGSWSVYSVDCSDPDRPELWTYLGNVNANHPTVGLQPMPLQVYTTDNIANAADIDFFGWGSSGVAR